MVLGAGGWWLFGGGSALLRASKKPDPGQYVVNRSTGTLDLAGLVSRQNSIADQDVTAGLNQQVNLNDAISFMVTGVERDWQTEVVKPGEGRELVKLQVTVGNRHAGGGLYVPISSFSLMDSQGSRLRPTTILTDEVPDALTSGEIGTGQSVSGTLIYEVTKGDDLRGLGYDAFYQTPGGDEVTIKALIKLN